LMLVIAVYCLGCLVVLESKNRAVEGGVLQQFHGEYAGGGSGKCRFGHDIDSDPRRPEYHFIKTIGLSVYPAAFIGILGSGYFYVRKQSRHVAFAALAVCGMVLIRFVYLGVFTAALG
jgi:hypothetical protein